MLTESLFLFLSKEKQEITNIELREVKGIFVNIISQFYL